MIRQTHLRFLVYPVPPGAYDCPGFVPDRSRRRGATEVEGNTADSSHRPAPPDVPTLERQTFLTTGLARGALRPVPPRAATHTEGSAPCADSFRRFHVPAASRSPRLEKSGRTGTFSPRRWNRAACCPAA